MIKSTIIKAIQTTHKEGFITRKELADAMGYKDPHSVDKYLKGLDKVGRKYFVQEVVERIAEGG